MKKQIGKIQKLSTVVGIALLLSACGKDNSLARDNAQGATVARITTTVAAVETTEALTAPAPVTETTTEAAPEEVSPMDEAKNDGSEVRRTAPPEELASDDEWTEAAESEQNDDEWHDYTPPADQIRTPMTLTPGA